MNNKYQDRTTFLSRFADLIGYKMNIKVNPLYNIILLNNKNVVSQNIPNYDKRATTLFVLEDTFAYQRMYNDYFKGGPLLLPASPFSLVISKHIPETGSFIKVDKG